MKPSTYRRVVTINLDGKSVVLSDDKMRAYEFKSVPDYEHTLVRVSEQRRDVRHIMESAERYGHEKGACEMKNLESDALVFFGATGDLAYEQIFPALHAMTRCGQFEIPIIGVGRSAKDLDALRTRAHESIEKQGDLDSRAFAALSAKLQYVKGDYSSPETFRQLCRGLPFHCDGLNHVFAIRRNINFTCNSSPVIGLISAAPSASSNIEDRVLAVLSRRRGRDPSDRPRARETRSAKLNNKSRKEEWK
jgi:hypothetical protein